MLRNDRLTKCQLGQVLIEMSGRKLLTINLFLTRYSVKNRLFSKKILYILVYLGI